MRDFPTAKLKQTRIAEQSKRLNEAKAKLAALEKEGSEVQLEILVDRMEVGHIGKLKFSESVIFKSADIEPRDSFEILQIVDEQNMLVKMFGQWVWIGNRSTEDFVDGKRARLSETFRVTGTKRYTTALGEAKPCSCWSHLPRHSSAIYRPHMVRESSRSVPSLVTLN